METDTGTTPWLHALVACNACGCTMTRGGLMRHRCPEKVASAAQGHALIERLSHINDPAPF